MKTLKWILFLSALIILASCQEEDPGPRQDETRTYSFENFDKLEVSDALNVTVQQGTTFSISAEGDRRNLDDLEFYQTSGKLHIRYQNTRNRQHNTYLTVTMPVLRATHFSGAVQGTVKGFTDTGLDISLSGASIATFNVNPSELFINLSGASQLTLVGTGDKLNSVISGASQLKSFDFACNDARLTVSGASSGKVSVTKTLTANASGASVVVYRGSPEVTANVTGSSSVRKE